MAYTMVNNGTTHAHPPWHDPWLSSWMNPWGTPRLTTVYVMVQPSG